MNNKENVKKYYKNHPEKYKKQLEYAKQWRKEHMEQGRQQRKNCRQHHPDYQKQYYQKNKDKILTDQKERRHKLKGMKKYMPGIRRKQSIGIIRGSGDDDYKPQISYCPRCLEYNQYRVLKERVQRIGESLSQSDFDNFKQCHSCGQLVPIYELKKESKLKDFVEPSSNPFDSGKSITGLDNKIKKIPRQKEKQKQKERIEIYQHR